jgi:lipopolysaccharide/colanic/teichoic acid biosynthesis glycosyltransferase
MYPFIKRFFDILASLLALVVLSPLLIPITIGLKLTGEGYIWYFQERVGFKNKLFSIYKFATMLKDSPNMAGGLITTKRDPRLTPLGDFLRSTKINELPQLINILNGNMSVVGPRPVMQKSFDAYPIEVQKVIYNVKPGLTGIGSIIFRHLLFFLSKKVNKKDQFKKRRLRSTVHSPSQNAFSIALIIIRLFLIFYKGDRRTFDSSFTIACFLNDIPDQ